MWGRVVNTVSSYHHDHHLWKYWYHLGDILGQPIGSIFKGQGSRIQIESWPLNNPEECSSHLPHGRSLKSHIGNVCLLEWWYYHSMALKSCLRNRKVLLPRHADIKKVNKTVISVVSNNKWGTRWRLVEALRYKPEGRGFDSRWCHWIFSLT